MTRTAAENKQTLDLVRQMLKEDLAQVFKPALSLHCPDVLEQYSCLEQYDFGDPELESFKMDLIGLYLLLSSRILREVRRELDGISPMSPSSALSAFVMEGSKKANQEN